MNIIVCGKRREGKTSYALVILRRWQEGNCGKIAWDTRHMMNEEMARKAGYSVLTICEEPEELEDAISDYEPGELIVVRPGSGKSGAEFSRLIGVMLDPPSRFENWSLLIDEAATVQSAHSIELDVDRIVRQHPTSALVIQTTHSLQDYHRASRDLTDMLVTFRLKGRSKQAFLEFCDGSEEMSAAIDGLPRHYAIAVDMGAATDEAEFRYIEPDSWYGQKSIDSNSDVVLRSESDATNKRTPVEGKGQTETFVEA